MTKKIRLDPGHGAGSAHNRGFISPGNEGEANYYMAIALENELKKYGFQVSRTRTNINQNPSLTERGSSAKGYDLLLSLHSNAASSSSVRGIEIFPDTNPWKSVGQSGYDLAWKITNAVSALGTPNRGVRTWNRAGTYRTNVKSPPYESNYFGVLRASEAPMAMLIEFAYHTNQNDRDFLVNKRQAIAATTAKVIADHYGITIERPDYTRTEFINMVRDDIIANYNKDSVLPSVALAQTLLESNNGNSELAKNANNIFGIKASPPWTGPSYTKKSEEYKDGTQLIATSQFRKYNSWKESIIDHSKFFVSTEERVKLYRPAREATNYKDATAALQGTYATDINYASKLNSIIESNKLYLFDEQVKKKEQEKKDESLYLNKAYSKEELMKMQPRFGIFIDDNKNQVYVSKILNNISGATQFSFTMTPSELFQKIVYIGSENIYPYYIFVQVTGNKETDEKTINSFIEANKTIKK